MKYITLILFLLLTPALAYTLPNKDFGYKRWRIHVNNMLYRPASTTALLGDYTINTRFMRGYKIGFEYYFRKGKSLQVITGLDMHFIPLDNYKYELPGKELGLEQESYHNYTFRFGRERHNVLSVPVGIFYSKILKNNLNIHFKGGINIDFIQYGKYTKDYEITNDRNIIKRYLTVNMISQYNNIAYPSLFLGTGIDYHTLWAKLHFTLNVQKALIPYMQGSYHFYNLDISPESNGTYKLWGDFIGLDIGITIKKFKKIR